MCIFFLPCVFNCINIKCKRGNCTVKSSKTHITFFFQIQTLAESSSAPGCEEGGHGRSPVASSGPGCLHPRQSAGDTSPMLGHGPSSLELRPGDSPGTSWLAGRWHGWVSWRVMGPCLSEHPRLGQAWRPALRACAAFPSVCRDQIGKEPSGACALSPLTAPCLAAPGPGG